MRKYVRYFTYLTLLEIETEWALKASMSRLCKVKISNEFHSEHLKRIQ